MSDNRNVLNELYVEHLLFTLLRQDSNDIEDSWKALGKLFSWQYTVYRYYMNCPILHIMTYKRTYSFFLCSNIC